jgi:acetyltransferase
VRQSALADTARSGQVRIIGPNCLGILVPGIGLNASFAHRAPRSGNLAFVAQSGAIVTSVLDWADARGILLYIESIKDARKFMSAARSTSRMKPIIVVKAGRHAEGARALASHNGALAGADAFYDAPFERAGILRVHSLEELSTPSRPWR